MSLTPAILKKRRKFICASDIGKLFNLYPDTWKGCSREDLWYEKKGITIDGEPIKYNPDLDRGNILEPTVARMCKKITKLKIYKANEMLVSKEHPWLAANPDYYVDVEHQNSSPERRMWMEIPVELKCPRQQSFIKMKEVGIPYYYILQCQAQMIVGNMPYCHFFAYCFDSMDHHYYKFEYNQDMAKLIIDESKKFHYSLKGDEPPPMFNEADFPEGKCEGEVLLNDETDLSDFQYAMVRWHHAANEVKVYQEVMDKCQKQIAGYFGKSKVVTDGKYRPRKIVKSGGAKFNLRRFIHDHPKTKCAKYWEEAPPIVYISKGPTPKL